MSGLLMLPLTTSNLFIAQQADSSNWVLGLKLCSTFDNMSFLKVSIFPVMITTGAHGKIYIFTLRNKHVGVNE